MPSLKNSIRTTVQKRNKEVHTAPSGYTHRSKTRPKTMTWGKASLVLSLCVVFDGIRFLCEFLYIFAGPFGIIADIVGFVGWGVVGAVMLATNARIFKENASGILWFLCSLIVDEVPLIGGVPGTTYAVWKMYNVQITKEKEVLRQYEEQEAESMRLKQQQQIAAFMSRVQATQNAEIAQEEEWAIEAANDEQFAAADNTRFQDGEAANDALYGEEYASEKSQGGVRKAA